MFSFAITGKGEGVLQKSSIPFSLVCEKGVLQKSSIPFSHTKEKAGRMEKE